MNETLIARQIQEGGMITGIPMVIVMIEGVKTGQQGMITEEAMIGVMTGDILREEEETIGGTIEEGIEGDYIIKLYYHTILSIRHVIIVYIDVIRLDLVMCH